MSRKEGAVIGPSIARRFVWAAIVAFAIYFALQAGEFSSIDILRQRARHARLQAQVDSLQKEVDSLTRMERQVRTDPTMQERIAREEFGMVRGNNEIIYKFVSPRSDSGNTDNH